VLLVRPDGHLVTALNGVRPTDLYAAAEAALGGAGAKAAKPAEEIKEAEAEAGAGAEAAAGSR
jgi:3-(3-hydroxy-phenyl)propionate hydroxylase